MWIYLRLNRFLIIHKSIWPISLQVFSFSNTLWWFIGTQSDDSNHTSSSSSLASGISSAPGSIFGTHPVLMICSNQFQIENQERHQETKTWYVNSVSRWFLWIRWVFIIKQFFVIKQFYEFQQFFIVIFIVIRPLHRHLHRLQVQVVLRKFLHALLVHLLVVSIPNHLTVHSFILYCSISLT